MTELSLYEKLLNAALRFVSYRLRSEKEITDYLLKVVKSSRINADGEINSVLKRMVELGYIDDLKFASWWIAARISTKPKGLRMIKYELEQKGIRSEIINLALSQIADARNSPDNIEFSAAQKSLKSKINIFGKLPVLERKHKIYQYLFRRGFSHETISRVIDENEQKDYNTNQ
jgi:regulatory protein